MRVPGKGRVDASRPLAFTFDGVGLQGFAGDTLASALIGAIFLLWADIVARTIMAPEDMPIGIVTGLVGGICFVWLLKRRS